MMGLGSTQTCMEKGQKEIGTNRSERNSIYQCEIASLVVVKHGAGCLGGGGRGCGVISKPGDAQSPTGFSHALLPCSGMLLAYCEW